jgi:hypothetical protein
MTRQVAREAKPPVDQAAQAIHRTARRAVLITSAWITLSIPSSASPIQYDYSGVIKSAPASSGIVAGTPFSGSFWFDPDQNIGLGFEGFNEYYLPGSASPASAGMTLDVGGIIKMLSSAQFVMTMNYTPSFPSDPKSPSSSVYIGDADAPSSLGLTLSNPSQNVLGAPSLQLPGLPPLSKFTAARLDYIQQAASGSMEFQGTITTMTLAPEPAHATFVCLAAGWLMIRRRARRHRELACPRPV